MYPAQGYMAEENKVWLVLGRHQDKFDPLPKLSNMIKIILRAKKYNLTLLNVEMNFFVCVVMLWSSFYTFQCSHKDMTI